MNSWIRTHSGRKFDPFNIDPEQIVIEDIAHALSNICRFTGHCAYFYSVATHSVLVSYHCDPEDALVGLLHDASEAYLADIARPIKYHPDMMPYRVIEDRLQRIILQRFAGTDTISQSIHAVDNRLLTSEASQLMTNFDIAEWPGYRPYDDFVAVRWSPTKAKAEFLQRFMQLL